MADAKQKRIQAASEQEGHSHKSKTGRLTSGAEYPAAAAQLDRPTKKSKSDQARRPRASAKSEGSNVEPLRDDEWMRGNLDRATKRLNALVKQVGQLEQTALIKVKEISGLQSAIARLKDGNLRLEERISELVRDNEALRAGESRQGRQISSLVRSTNKLQNNLFWTVCHFVAGSSDFEAFARSVDYDLTRLFCMLLTVEISQCSDLAPDIKAHAAAISNIFDPFFYLTEYQDVALDGLNPLLHYLQRGYRENREPTRLFDRSYYLQQVPLQDEEPLLHYIQKGVKAGLKPHPLFDSQFYLDHNADVADRDINPLFHYQTWGGRERRDPSPLFDTEYFLESRNVPTMVDNPLQEYLMGLAQTTADPHPLFLSSHFREQTNLPDTNEAALVVYLKRPDLNLHISPHPLFDLDYIQERQGVQFTKDISPLEAFCRVSRDRDIDPSALFDSKLYRYQVEVERGCTLADPPVVDYLKRGYMDKTILPNVIFDPKTYLERNKIEVSGPELVHYCLEGDDIGFSTHPLFSAKVYNEERGHDGGHKSAVEHFLDSSGGIHVSHPHVGRSLPREMVDFVKRVYLSDVDFDCQFYQELYPDLAAMSVEDATGHYNADGRAEGRLGSARSLVQESRLLIRDIPLGFFSDEYLHFNSDLIEVGSNFLPLLGHYLRYGRLEQRTIGRWQFYLDTLDLRVPSLSAPLTVTANTERIDVCLLMHLFYPDLWPEIAAFARNFEPLSRDVFVNVVDIAWSPHFQRELRELCPGAYVQLSNNSGRDIGGLLRLLDNVDIKKYDFFAFMHDKRSPHIPAERAEYWRRSLLNAFAGSQEIVAECIEVFRADPTVGLIGAKEWRSTELGKNEAEYSRMLDLFEIDEQHRSLEYVSGTMFLIRSDVVQRIYDVLKSTKWEHGGDKDLSIDGQLAHATERLVGNLVRQMGYRMVWR
jgi:hypothetical protein